MSLDTIGPFSPITLFLEAKSDFEKYDEKMAKVIEHFAVLCLKIIDLLTGFDYSVDNESLETIYWLK